MFQQGPVFFPGFFPRSMMEEQEKTPLSSPIEPIVFRVDAKRTFRKVVVLMPVMMNLGFFLWVLLNWAKGTRGLPLPPLSLLQTLLVICGISFLGFGIALVFSLSLRRAWISVDGQAISGLNGWGSRRSVPLDELIGTSMAGYGGGKALVVHSRKSGKLLISIQMEHFEELCAFLQKHIDKNTRGVPCEGRRGARGRKEPRSSLKGG